MGRLNEEDMQNQNALLMGENARLQGAVEALRAENARLQEAVDSLRNRFESNEGEIKFLLRKTNKLLEEKVMRLEEELQKNIGVLDGIAQL